MTDFSLSPRGHCFTYLEWPGNDILLPFQVGYAAGTATVGCCSLGSLAGARRRLALVALQPMFEVPRVVRNKFCGYAASRYLKQHPRSGRTPQQESINLDCGAAYADAFSMCRTRIVQATVPEFWWLVSSAAVVPSSQNQQDLRKQPSPCELCHSAFCSATDYTAGPR